jgi:hypothetical protein
MSDIPYYVSAILGRDRNSLEVRTKVFSPTNLRALLNDDPAAITLGPKGAWGLESLLEAFGRQRTLRVGRGHARVHRWRAYERFRYESMPPRVRSLDSNALEQQLVTMNFDQMLEAAFVSETVLEDGALMSVIDSVISDAIAPPTPQNRSSQRKSSNPEIDNRHALRAARQEMLNSVGTFTSEEIASVLDSTSSNASQCAADQRTAGKIFGVRFGREWHYPKFQFDRSRKPIEIFPEVKPLLAALSPDERGWDRLQWFLQPHEGLSGRTPLEMWQKDRAAVVTAASTERWNGRD